MILYRPVGQKEYDLIKASGFKAFPPRLSEQPIFYPVLNEEYASEITSKWNTEREDKVGYVMRFLIDDEYVTKFEVQTVGRSYHQELWVPAEELGEFNNHLIGEIETVKKYKCGES